MILAVYVYQTAAGTQSVIDSDDYNYAGTWSASGTYKAATLDTVAYGNARYITIIDNIGGSPVLVPPRNISKKWSVLAKIREGAEPPWSSGTVAPEVAVTALYTAWAGTDLAGTALQTAWAGTATANQALQTAWAGTNLALQTAWVGTVAGISGTVYAAFQRFGTTDTQLVFTNGILTSWNYPT
jgi:hypothetical protein